MTATTQSAAVVAGLVSLFALAAIACPSCRTSPSSGAPEVRMTFTRPDFYAAAFPSDDLLAEGGRISLGAFPNPNGVKLVNEAPSLLSRDARGFAMAGGVFFSLTAPIEHPALPDLAGSIAKESSVFLSSASMVEAECRRPMRGIAIRSRSSSKPTEARSELRISCRWCSATCARTRASCRCARVALA
jgi:hypothetical protein